MGTMEFETPETQTPGEPVPQPVEPPEEMPAAESHPTGTESRRTQDIIGKPVISTNNGQVLGNVTDLLIDPETMRIAVLLVTRGGLLSRETVWLPMDDVQAWGQNAIMVTKPEAARQRTPEMRKWVSAANQVRGRSIVTLDGTRVGQVSDAVIDPQGRVIEFELGEGAPGKEKRRVPAGTTHALGQDVIIVDPTRA